jgi:CRISPR-associated protein Cas2
MLRPPSRGSGMHRDVLIVVRLERVPERIRGDLSLWLLEIDTGMFVGDVSPEVRDHLWQRIVRALPAGAGAVLVHPARTAQGFAVLVAGDPTREVVDAEGLTLIRRPPVDSPRRATSAVDW